MLEEEVKEIEETKEDKLKLLKERYLKRQRL